MVTVGITGGIGSGKSTVCRFWSEMGAYILNADDLAKQVMVNDPAVREELTDTFGAASFSEDGSLNREHLAVEAFRNHRVEELNAIVHPRLPAASKQKMEEAELRGCEVFVYEAALLLENLKPGRLDYIVLVLADENQRLERVRERDNAGEAEVERRINSQRDFEKAVGRADFVIRNNGTLQDLKRKSENIFKKFLL